MGEINLVPDIQKTILLEAPIQKVWDTVSTAEGISAWFMPNDFQPLEGHEFHIQSPFGPSPCKVLEVDPPNRLSFSWDTDGWVVIFELQEREGKTEFSLTHTGWKPADETIGKAGEKSAVIRDRMNQGWQSIVAERLKKAVEE
ncbi:uncharacterized protein YndB with AHSA1/START domain [Peribacillus deserti]|uniref:Uncharacterized protein YndB with AHSA1/START domain n=1 Tax=Peribacillus deserti TaxID=673318 RepID=A0ABS2QDX3_9BACI|nr:SRPBCC domain-containing protein [Peribacillus deserti]MBM7691230.1 uncharacterized protein YndB with AHSA1/START domain [Peribacillus deserti]